MQKRVNESPKTRDLSVRPPPWLCSGKSPDRVLQHTGVADIKGQQPGTANLAIAPGSPEERAFDTTSNDDLWSRAVETFQSGDRLRATANCDQILADDPDHPDSWHLKGTILITTSDSAKGLEFIQKSISLAPDRASFRENLAEILIASKEYSGAITQLKALCEIDATKPAAHRMLGVALVKNGDLLEALDSLFRALSMGLNHSRTWFWIGKALVQQERLEEAVLAFRAAVSVPAEEQSDHTEAWFQLGRVLFNQKDLDGAALAYEKVIEGDPECIASIHNLGDVFIHQGELDRALETFERVLAINPAEVSSHLGIGLALLRKSEFQESIAAFEHALSMASNDEDNAEARTCLGILYLMHEDFARGWPLYESRREDENHRRRESDLLDHPEWKGESLRDKTILVYAEQGFGDVIQFVRYLPMLHARGARVLFEPQPGLESLLRGNDLQAEIVSRDAGKTSPSYDLYAPLGSLPYRFATDLSTIPSPGPYLHADSRKSDRYRTDWFEHPNLKVGIVWQGSPLHRHDSIRSTRLSSFAPLCRMEGVWVYSLQKGPGHEQLAGIPDDAAPFDLGATFGDFSDTAAAIDNLDLVITVDTSVGHLSAALGKPTWILLSTVPDWRWFLDREDSPWYSSVRLFRQKKRDDWKDVFDRILFEVEGFGHRENPKPFSNSCVVGQTAAPRQEI